MFQINSVKFVAVFLSVITLMAVLCSCGTTTVKLEDPVLCIAESKSERDSEVTSLDLDIPENACITKLYAALRQTDASKPISGGFIMLFIDGEVFYAHLFNKDPAAKIGSFETTFVQPLRVGPDGATVRVAADNVADMITITVVYCTENPDEDS